MFIDLKAEKLFDIYLRMGNIQTIDKFKYLCSNT